MAMKLYSDVSVKEIADSIRVLKEVSYDLSGEITPKYKIREMADAIKDNYEKILDYIPTDVLSGTTNQEETIYSATNLPIKSFAINGISSQIGTPTISNKIDVTGVFSVTISFEDLNNNTKERTLNFDGYGLYSLGDGTKDELKIENGHLYIVKNTKKIKLTSSMSWSIYPAKNGMYCASFASDYGIQKLNYNMYSTHFSPSSTVWDADYKMGWGASSPNTTLWLTFNSGTSEFSTSQQFKNWLDENNCYIIGKATTPQTIDLGEIDSIFTFEGTNTVEITTNLGTTYTLEYRQQISQE